MAEIAILTFVGKAVASTVIRTLVNRAFTTFDDYRKSEGMAATKEKLDHNLPRIQAVLLAVDRGQIKDQNAALDKWLWQLRDSVQEAEDAIDELHYLKLKEKVKDEAYVNGGCTTPMKKKITKLLESVPVKTDDSLKRLKNAVEGLSKVAAGVSSFIQIATAVSNSIDGAHQSRADTGAMLTESKVFGRDKEKALILKWLSTNSDSSDISAFSIVGMGGLGKTTLARLVYKDINDKELVPEIEFSPVIWVSVSDIFGSPDAIVIIRNILQDITKESHNLNTLSPLQTILKDVVMAKKFLLIFDDVWQDGPEAEKQWREIMAPLKFNKEGSRILVTTRHEVVADMMARVMEGTGEKKKNRLLLGGLEEQEFLNLFNRQVFGAENPQEYNNLQRLAKQLVKKLKGSPLAVKVIDNLLNNHTTDVHYWDQIINQDISRILIDRNGIIATLKLNYDHLTEDVQQCFRYCSLFPQHHKFKRDELIEMWIGSGLIQFEVPHGQSPDTLRPEDLGAGYFDTLVKKSFFYASNSNDSDSEDCYLMHEFVHELAVFVSSGECFRTKDNVKSSGTGTGTGSISIPTTIRHLSITTDSLLAIKKITHLRHLQSLFIEFNGQKPGPTHIKEFQNALMKLKCLRLFSLVGDNLFELPKAIGDLIHIRYICLQQTSDIKELDWLPKSSYRLYHLQTMGFKAHGVHGLMEKKLYGMGNLVSLRYLHAPSSVMRILPGIGKMTSLQKLELFNSQEVGRKIGELGNLNSLIELHINSLDKLKGPEEAEKAKMKDKVSLRSLSLNWSGSTGEDTDSKQTLANLEPHHRLQKLHISNYGGDSFPNWITNPVKMLISLELRTCAKCNTLPPLGKLRSLKYLLISCFPELEQISSSSFYGKIPSGGDTFPSLQELTIVGMNKLEKWVDTEGRRKFPRLEKLVIEDCPQLTTLPTLPDSLSILEIKNNSGIQKLPTGIKFLRKLRLVGCQMLLANQSQHSCFPSSLEELIIEDCGDDTSLVCSIQNLFSLTRLELSSCHNITSLPREEIFLKLASLCEVCIQNCTKLSSFGGLHALRSLKFLKVSGCNNLVTVSENKPPPSDTNNPSGNNYKLKIEELHIDHCSLLLMEPLNNTRPCPCQVKTLHVLKTCQPESLPKQWLESCTSLEQIEVGNSCALKALPSNLDKLTALKKLVMHQAALIESLPDLPHSLSDLVLTGCNNVFKKRYEKNIGSNWYELADVTTVIIC